MTVPRDLVREEPEKNNLAHDITIIIPRNIPIEELNASEHIEDILQEQLEKNCLDYEHIVAIPEILPVRAEIQFAKFNQNLKIYGSMKTIQENLKRITRLVNIWQPFLERNWCCLVSQYLETSKPIIITATTIWERSLYHAYFHCSLKTSKSRKTARRWLLELISALSA